jgi:putative polyhydroxyalkanoate system protein
LKEQTLADIRIHREHQLGLAKARQVAAQWSKDVENDFEMRCRRTEGEYSDTIEFTRSGVNGRLIVAADHFDLDAKLGFLLGVFRHKIETEIQAILDKLLADAKKAPAKKVAAKKTAAAKSKK